MSQLRSHIHHISSLRNTEKTNLVTKNTSNSLFSSQKRFIALYRPVAKPWNKHELTPNPEEARQFHQVIKGHIDKGEDMDALQLLHLCRGRGVLPRLETYRMMILMFYKNGDRYSMQSAFEEMLSNRIIVDTYSLYLMLDIYAKNGLIVRTEKTFADIFVGTEGQVGEFALTSMLNCYVLRERWEKAIPFIYGMTNEYGLEVDPETIQKVAEGSVALAKFHYERLEKYSKDVIDNSTDQGIFESLLKDSKPMWDQMKQGYVDATKKSFTEETNPVLYYGKRGNTYDDESSNLVEADFEYGEDDPVLKDIEKLFGDELEGFENVSRNNEKNEG